MKDRKFRDRLDEMLQNKTDDEEIIKYVLNHAWNQWSHSFHMWLNKKISHSDGFFNGDRYKEG